MNTKQIIVPVIYNPLITFVILYKARNILAAYQTLFCNWGRTQGPSKHNNEHIMESTKEINVPVIYHSHPYTAPIPSDNRHFLLIHVAGIILFKAST
ncbi:hypothetical protein SAMN05421807_10465 [Virgibacillus chiguensis]|uniref:Uncharacterized protein n=1 Tax=Virgibacillus chiguensis TaxID=411959 RepID=A0A1M5QCQ7_9BACI|nr:hypothetical protein SAMN05421807_10465 [Virgibacillus chiguensis]